MTELRAKTYNTVARGTCPQCDEIADLQFVWYPDGDRIVCGLCAGNINAYHRAHPEGADNVDELFVRDVESHVGAGRAVWGVVSAQGLCRAVLAVAAERKEGGR